ncbi:MAG: 50S ribosomal protein L3, partial [Pseudomonadota bacterium]
WVEVRDAVKKARHADAPAEGSFRKPGDAATPAEAPEQEGGE